MATILSTRINALRNMSPRTITGTTTGAYDPASTAMSLTLESVALQADSKGAVQSYEGAATTVTMTQSGADVTSLWTLTRIDGTGVTSTLAGNVLTITGLTVDAATITVTAARAGYSSITKSLRVTRTLAGENGSVGSRNAYGTKYGISVSSWSSEKANRVIWNELTNEVSTADLSSTAHLALGDTVTLSNGIGYAETRYWSGISWVAPGTVIPGNLLVKGTVSADALCAGEIVTGQDANARIAIGNTTFVGTIKSPMHVSKVSAAAWQSLITAQNTKDDSVAIWGSSAYALGNAVAGTWHASAAEATAGKWKLIGVLGSDMANAAVSGAAYNYPAKYAGNFEYFSTDSNSTSPVVAASVKLATATALGTAYAMIATGAVQLFGTASPIIVNSTAGSAGQVLTSQGVGVTPKWADAPGAGSVTYSSIKTCFAGATGSVLDLTTTFRVTGTNVPTYGSGVELAYYGGEGFVIAGTRNSGGAISSYSPLHLQGSTVDMNVTPTFPTASTSDNSTKGATTAFVKSQGYITSSGSITGSSGSCTGNAATATSAASCTGNAATATTAGDSTTVGGKKVKGGTGTGGSAVSTGLSSVEGFSAIAVDGFVASVSSVSGGSVTVKTRNFSGVESAQAFRWVATGT